MVAEGYKDTEIGVIPIEWDVVELDNIVEFKNGKGHEQVIDESGQYIVVNSKFISTNGNVYKSSNSNLSPLKSNDITLVMSDIPNGKALAKCFYINEDDRYTLNQRICSLTAIKDNPLYLFYRLNRNRYFLKFNDGVSQTNLRKNEVLECKIPLPPLKEQEKIADILSTTDDKIDTITSQIKKTETLKKGLLQKLLSEGIGHSKFKDSELGKIPLSWEVVELEKGCNRIIGGGTPSKTNDNYWNNGTILWATPTEFTKSNDRYISKTILKITQEGLDNSSATLLRQGTVIMSSRATIGECKINTIEMTTNQGFISYECNEILNNLFLLYLIGHYKDRIIKVSSGSTFLEVSRTTMRNFKIPLPPLEEQKQIANILSTADEKLEVLRAKKEKYETLKKGLLQKLLSGEVRV